MKNKYKTKKHFSTFLAAISCFILLLSISSCEFFTFSDLKEKENAANATEQLNSEKIYKLHITPRFGNENLYKQTSSRSAFPDFSSFDFSLYTFKATSSVLTQDATGTFNSVSGDISYSFSAPTSSEPVDFTFYICDSSGKELFYGAQQITYTTLGSEISKTVYFKSYDSSEVNGHIDLKVAVTSGYTLYCEIKNSSNISVCGNTGDPISVDSSGNITTGTDGIAPGTYKAYISVKKGSQLYDYIIQDINVWPDLTTNRWYLPDGTTSQTYNIEISEDKVKFWVKGTSPGGPYASDVIVPASYTADGSITKPFTSLNAAIAACTSSTTNYRIVVSGTINENATIGSSVSAHSITIEGCENSTNDILKQSSSGAVLTINNTFPVTLRKIRVMDGLNSGIKVINSSCAGLYLLDDAFIYMNASDDMGGGIYSMAPVIVDGATIKRNNAERGGGIAIDSVRPSESYGLIIKSGTICENLTVNADDLLGGGGVYASDSTVSMTSGTISSNETVSFGGALYLYESEFYISDSAYIPAGNENQNYIYLNNSAIEITGKLTPPAASGGIVACVKPYTYSTTATLFRLNSSVTNTTLRKELKKFTLIQDADNPTTTWAFTSTGGLQEAVAFAYPASTAGSFNGSTQISEVFKQNRKIGNIKGITASDHETTQGEYELYCKYFSGCEPTTAIGKGDYYPVYKVSWYDAIIYCNLRSIDEGYEPVYVVGGKTNPTQWTGIDGNYLEGWCAPSGCSWDVTILADKNGWRLPTEIEWEYLARGGNVSDDEFIYSGDNDPDYVAWYGGDGGNSEGKVHPVKSLGANDLHLFDMSGNVWEWTNDWHSDATAWPWIPLDTPTSGSYPDKSNGCRVTKGGGYSGDVGQSPVANRGRSAPNDRNADMGFRVVRGAQYVGSKLPSVYKEVGDIVFNDGSAMSYEDYNALSSAEQNTLKANAIAIIFYKGTGLNNGSDTTTVRTLGVGLKHNTTNSQLCINGAEMINKNITAIQCNHSATGVSATFTGDLNGSDNFDQIVNFSGITDTGTAANYPAFYFARNYKNTATNIIGTPYEDGWYLPSIAEFFQIWKNGKNTSENKIFDIDAVSSALGGSTFGTATYWTSSQNSSSKNIYYFQLQGVTEAVFVGYMIPTDKYRYCCIHEF